MEKYKKTKIKRRILVVTMIVLVCFMFIYNYITNSNIDTTNARVYECDYKSINIINTDITTTYNDEKISIKGNIMKLVTDPLTAKDSKGNTIGYAGDAYGFISQDDHGIYIDGVFDVNMCGNVDLWGESYTLKDDKENVIGNVKFNFSNTHGEITDTNGNIIAFYKSAPLMNDYKVIIYDNELCSDLSILMIVASYVSDYKYDSSN